jgi:hypothetical protein
METMSKEERRLQTKIILFEDMMFRSKNVYEQEQILQEIRKMRVKLQKMQFENWAKR